MIKLNMRLPQKISFKSYFLILFLVFGAFALTLYFMGHPLICKCGYVKIWHGNPVSSENSQHLTDWYTFSHIIHGFIFYWLARLIGKRFKWSLPAMLLFALFIEMVWEIFENTDFVINRYRETTISLDYYGDSVINSVFDVLSMVLGFLMAYCMPVWSIVAIALALEIFVGYKIRDNLILNIIMLIYPFKSILLWQKGE